MSDEAENTDTTLCSSDDGGWRIFTTVDYSLGIELAGHVIVRPVREWHNAADRIEELEAEGERLKAILLKDRKLADACYDDALLWNFSAENGDHPTLLVKVWRQRKEADARSRKLEAEVERLTLDSDAATEIACDLAADLLEARAALATAKARIAELEAAAASKGSDV